MAFCPNCGSQADGRFCPKCGASMGAGATPPPASPPPYSGEQQQTPPPPPYSAPAGTGLPENAANALCYLFGAITGILFLVMEPYSRNPRTRFHAFQSIFFTVGVIVLQMCIWTMAFLLPGPLTILLGVGSMFVSLGIFLGWLFLMWKAYQGEKFVLPIVGPLAEQQVGR